MARTMAYWADPWRSFRSPADASIEASCLPYQSGRGLLRKRKRERESPRLGRRRWPQWTACPSLTNVAPSRPVRCTLIPPLLYALAASRPPRPLSRRLRHWGMLSAPLADPLRHRSDHPQPLRDPTPGQARDRLAPRRRPLPLLAYGRIDGQEDRPGQALSSQRLTVVLKALEDRGVPRGQGRSVGP